MENSFDAIEYFKEIGAKNKLARANNFFVCQNSGIATLDEMLVNFQKQSAFISIDDTTDGATSRRGGGFFDKRVYTIFILKRYKFGDMQDRHLAMNVCKKIYKQIYSKLIKDSGELNNQFIYLNTDNMYFREIGQYFLNGCTGLYFMVEVMESAELSYNEEDWNE